MSSKINLDSILNHDQSQNLNRAQAIVSNNNALGGRVIQNNPSTASLASLLNTQPQPPQHANNSRIVPMSLLINPDYTTQSNQIPNNNTSQQSPIFQATVRPSSVESLHSENTQSTDLRPQRKRKEITPYIPTNKESSSSSADEIQDDDYSPSSKRQKADLKTTTTTTRNVAENVLSSNSNSQKRQYTSHKRVRAANPENLHPNPNPGFEGLPCANCQAKESPEWRKGLDNKKNLCNACGLAVQKLKKLEASIPVVPQHKIPVVNILNSYAHETSSEAKETESIQDQGDAFLINSKQAKSSTKKITTSDKQHTQALPEKPVQNNTPQSDSSSGSNEMLNFYNSTQPLSDEGSFYSDPATPVTDTPDRRVSLANLKISGIEHGTQD